MALTIGQPCNLVFLSNRRQSLLYSRLQKGGLNWALATDALATDALATDALATDACKVWGVQIAATVTEPIR